MVIGRWTYGNIRLPSLMASVLTRSRSVLGVFRQAAEMHHLEGTPTQVLFVFLEHRLHSPVGSQRGKGTRLIVTPPQHFCKHCGFVRFTPAQITP